MMEESIRQIWVNHPLIRTLATNLIRTLATNSLVLNQEYEDFRLHFHLPEQNPKSIANTCTCTYFQCVVLVFSSFSITRILNNALALKIYIICVHNENTFMVYKFELDSSLQKGNNQTFFLMQCWRNGHSPLTNEKDYHYFLNRFICVGEFFDG